MFTVIAMQRFDLKNSIVAIKLYLVMILNLDLPQNDLHVKRGAKVRFWWLCFQNKIIIILIQVKKDSESVTVISVEHYSKVNSACFKCLKIV